MLAWLICGGMLCACGEVPRVPCSGSNPCMAGFACSRSGVCVEAERLAIATVKIPPARLGSPYRVQLEARGGIPPYRDWSLTPGETPWLSLAGQSGVLSGTPDGGGWKTVLSVTVTDSSFGAGIPASPELTLGITCDGWDPCAAGALCCDATCVDPLTELGHCGGCGNDCAAAVARATQAHCARGACDYQQCAQGTLDCNGNRADGCETPVDSRHCGGCRVDCGTDPRGRICLDPGRARCGCRTAEDCESGAVCCGRTCVAVDERHCGDCATDCTGLESNRLCIVVSPSRDSPSRSYRCGCVGGQLAVGCRPGQVCVDGSCR